MVLRVPSYYKEFKCIAGDCKHSCCIGWEVDIDEDTFSYYSSVKGEIGKRLANNMVSEECNSFRLRENGWCPFLNKKKLCDICIELGEEALSEVCTEYPRFTTEYENVREKILSLSCEAVGRLVFSTEEKITWEEMELPGEIEIEDELPEAEAAKIQQIEQEAVALLQNREISIFDRTANYLRYCRQKQEELFGQGDSQEETKECAMDDGGAYRAFQKRMEYFEELEVLDNTWEDVKKELYAVFTEENYGNAKREFLHSEGYREVEYEHLLVYFTYRYFMRAYYDDNIWSKAQFAVLSVLMIRDMDVARYLRNHHRYEKDDRIETARIYSREVEHSEENMELLEEDFQFEEIFCVNQLIQQISI